VIQIIIAIDPSTHFLYKIIDNIKGRGVDIKLTEIHPTEESYANCVEEISHFEKGTPVVFLGHGQSDQLYGGENLDSFPKRPIIKLNKMNIFKGQYLFLLACDSAKLIKSSFRLSKVVKSIGFGGLPTSMEEVEKDKKLSTDGISEQTIDDFKSEIVDTVSNALSFYYKDFNRLSDYLKLLIDQRINNAVLRKKDRNLADLLFKMRNEMVFY